ncbi:MAG: TolC family protein [Endomicrobia bacterium]|nr:TolC family protein [Endomicrobiia bacterium]
MFILSLMFLSGLSYAASVEKITWDGVVRQTNEFNPSVKTAKFKLDNAKQAYNRSLSGFMPDVSLNAAAGQSGGDSGFSRSYSYGLSAGLTIFSGFSTYNEVKQRSTELESAQVTYNRAVSDAAYNVETQYINLMWAYETVDMLKQILERRSENRDMVKLKYDSGNVDQGSLKRVEADVELASFNLKQAQRYIETASAALLNAIGRNDDIILNTDERLALKERELSRPDFNTILSTIPEFLIAQYSVDSYKAQLAKTKSQWWPTLSASGSLSRRGNEWAPDNNAWSAGLSLSYPLFSGGTAIADVNTSSNMLKISEENMKNVINSLRASAVSYYNNMANSVEIVSVREFYLNASRLQAEISSRKYVNGLATYQEWYQIENDYISSQSSFLDSKRSAAAAKVQWYNFLGQGFVQPGK